MAKQKQPSAFSSCASGLLLFLVAGALVVFGVSKLVKMGLNSKIATNIKEGIKEVTAEQQPEQIIFPDTDIEEVDLSDDEIRDVEIVPDSEAIPIPEDGIQVGGFYAIPVQDRYYNLYKVVAVRENYVYLTLYKDRFNQLPENVTSENLTALVSNVKIVKVGFKSMNLELVGTEPVSQEELDVLN